MSKTLEEAAHAMITFVACSEQYQLACTRKNCALATLWFTAKFCTQCDRDTAEILSSGGVLIRNLEKFSLYYQYMTNTEKEKASKSCFEYAARQNLENHFIYMSVPVYQNPNKYLYFYNPHFLNRYDTPDGNITREIIVKLLRPWSQTLTRAKKNEYQQLFHSCFTVVKLL